MGVCMMSDFPFPVWGTQGGGLVKRSGGQYIFVEKPDCPGLDVGDTMPDEWGIIPANQEARDEMNRSDGLLNFIQSLSG